MLTPTTLLLGSLPTSPTASSADEPQTSKAPDETAIHVTPLANKSYRIQVGRHTLTIDQPNSGGGEDLGPRPTELFVAGLAGCVAHYAGSYLARHDVPADGLAVDADFVMADEAPARIASVTVTITPPVGLPENRRAGLLAVASHCTLHNTLHQAPSVDISLSERRQEAA